jgi:hypothetical protein
MVLFVAGTFVTKRLGPSAVGWALAVTTPIAGCIVMGAYIRFLRHADELLRKIHLESLALGFGGGLLFIFSYRLFERLGAPQIDTNDAALVMMAFAAIGQWLGMAFGLARLFGQPIEEIFDPDA